MRTVRITAPNAAELYFNHSLAGYLSTLLADALAKPLGRRESGSPRAGDARRASAPPAETSGVLDRLDAWFWRQEQKQREAYLARSRDVFELERRIAALERAPLTRYY